MQKKLIAAAVAGLLAVPAMAQTNVTISGRFAAGWEHFKLSDCTVEKCNGESRVSDQSSRIIFSVVEDLGGGLSAWGQLDARFSNDLGGQNPTTAGAAAASSPWAGGNTGMGLMHKNWGKFTIGRWDVHYGEIEGAIAGNRAGSLQTLLGNGIMSQVRGSTIAVGSRTPNLLMWDSPNWNGFTARLAYSTNIGGNEGGGWKLLTQSGDQGGGYAWTGALRYNNGPWTAGYSYWKANSEDRREVAATGAFVAARADQRSNRLWLGYTFGMGLKLGIAWDRSTLASGAIADTSTTNRTRSAWMLPVSYTWGPHKVYGVYSRAGDASNTAGSQTGAHAWNLGYDYAFSKRTSAGVYWTKVNNKAGGTYQMFGIGANGTTAALAGEDVRQIYIGMAHNF